MKKIIKIALASLVITSCNQKNTNNNEPITLQGNAYGSTYSIIYYGNDVNNGILKLLNEFDDSVNTYKENSYLTKFNNSEKGEIADKMFKDLVEISMKYNTKSNGYFNPSIEPLSELWGFSNRKIKNSPKKEQVDSVMQFIGLNHISIKNDSILKDDSRVKLSFNSITGYINDKVAEFMNENQIDNYLIEIGGEVYAKGNKPDNSEWRIGIDEPNENLEERKIKAVVSLKNEGLATSGNYRKFHIDEKTGEKIVHTINPTTGYAKSSKLLSATVIAKTTAEADAMATAIMAMGLDNAVSFIEKNKDLKCYLIWLENNEIKFKNYNGFEYEPYE